MRTVQKSRIASTVILSLALSANASFADDCSTYPLGPGLTATTTQSGPKIVSTAVVSVDFDEQQEVLDATKRAELFAKGEISKFFSETIQTSESLDEALSSKITISGATDDAKKTAQKETLRTQLTSIKSNSSALLKGVVVLGSCYTTGKVVMVTVGIKPETVAAASDASAMINSDGSTSPAANATNDVGGTKVEGVAGFSNTKGLDGF